MHNRLQRIGSKLSQMILPNISAFIIWGFLTALFIPTGWFPDEKLALLVEPMAKYLLPIMIAYTGGKLIYDTRGGVIGSAATFGAVVATDVPMFAGAMLLGPLAAYLIKKADNLIEKKIPGGFEMLIHNFSAGILGLLMLVLTYLLLGPLMTLINEWAGQVVSNIIDNGYIAFSAVIIEPAKILFLNNIINHGILSPMGLMETLEEGKSILFLLETNPGPGLGVLLAYWKFGKGVRKHSAPGASLIHFLGGIHEVYFPFVLANPLIILPLILGGLTGNLIFGLLQVGLTATPSPGSIFSLLALTAKGDHLGLLLGIVGSCLVSFFLSIVFIRDKDEEVEGLDLPDMVKCIAIACDAGMGSSAMAASRLKKLLMNEDIEVLHIPVDQIPDHVDIVITHKLLVNRISNQTSAKIIGVSDLMNDKKLEKIVLAYKGKKGETGMFFKKEKGIIRQSRIYTGLPSEGKFDAIRRAGQALKSEGLVEEAYIKAMEERENIATTYIGSSVAIPHGTNESKSFVNETGIVVLQYPDGIDFGDGNIAKLVIGIAASGDEHLDILMKIADAVSNNETLAFLTTEEDSKKILKTFEKTGLGG
ncbi:PTS mannitol transporter subunit IICBA [Acidaminobacter sp. JC074]|uniref:PTS sugar transporter subunit IIA n=1 Tax=Acidaminobacter sp. JC074 TaxID=2530199 RepID=UPI001F0F919C|nr:PTS sugar transporter subunit IIA [Acidaminobacter sp. JC074]MCH4889527.1 PTS mannitol transporter subunit IICBA [Acidaminobacter sp. JC074]